MEKRKITKPSDLLEIFPFGSVMNKTEHEIVATKIVRILSYNGDKFREIKWKEYRKRLEETGILASEWEWALEKEIFDSVKNCCVSAESAALFSPKWKGVEKAAPKPVCKITNDSHSWVLEVDGQHVQFFGHDNAEYFRKHYSDLGYKIEWDKSKWEREQEKWL